MSVKYEQKATYQYSEEKFTDKAFCKVAKKLMDNGITLVGYHYHSGKPEVVYGRIEQEVVDTHYEISVDGKPAFTTTYRTMANEIVDEMKTNGFDAESSEVSTTKKSMAWQKPKGSRMYIDLDGLEGDLSYNKAELRYDIVHPRNDGMEDDVATVEFEPRLINSTDGVTLKFKTTLSLDRVLRSDRVKPSMVDATLKDFGRIKHLVEDALGITNAITTDCTFEVITQSESECSPDIIRQRQEATNSARNASQEEE
tara:strand:+ start:2265 stop:3029 length:765 start_codon:yes stop_codon:yes gene_type:complete